MADFTDRIKLIFDVDKNAGTSALKSFGDDFRNAEGFGNKFKVAAGGALDYAKDHAAQLAAVGGAALVAFAVKSLDAFEDMARQAKETADATGLTVEQASRWTAVADDAGVSSEALAKSMGAVIKGLDKGPWEKIVGPIHDVNGALKPTNELMLEAFDALAKIPPGTERAAAGNALFKKSYADLAPMIGKSREEIEKQLAAVEKGQVITDAESAKAEKMRKAQDQLADALHEVTLAVGEEVAELSPLIVQLAKIVGLVDKLGLLSGFVAHDSTKVVDGFDSWAKAALQSGDAMGYLTAKGLGVGAAATILQDYARRQIEANIAAGATAISASAASATLVEVGRSAQRSGDATAVATEQQNAFNHAVGIATGVLGDAKDGYQRTKTTAQELATVLGELNTGAVGDVKLGFEQAKTPVDAFNASINATAAATTTAGEAYDLLMGRLNAKEAWTNAQEAVDLLHWKMADGSSAAEVDKQLLATEKSLATYISTLDGVPDKKKTELYAELDQGNVDAVMAQLDELTHARTINAKVIVTGGGPIKAGYASGTESATGGWTKVNEQGMEDIYLPPGSVVKNATQTAMDRSGRGGGGLTVQVVVQGSLIHQNDLVSNLADGLIDLVNRGVLPPGFLG